MTTAEQLAALDRVRPVIAPNERVHGEGRAGDPPDPHRRPDRLPVRIGAAALSQGPRPDHMGPGEHVGPRRADTVCRVRQASSAMTAAEQLADELDRVLVRPVREAADDETADALAALFDPAAMLGDPGRVPTPAIISQHARPAGGGDATRPTVRPALRCDRDTLRPLRCSAWPRAHLQPAPMDTSTGVAGG